MSTKPDIVIVVNDDQEGIYVNGILQYEYHSLSLSQVIELFKEGYRSLKYETIDEDWLEDYGSYPRTLTEFYEIKTEVGE